MRILEESVTLVIAGAWNPAILSPNWIAAQAMQLQVGENFQVQVQLPMGLGALNLGGARPRLAFEGITVSAEPHAVTFKLAFDDEAQVQRSINTAARILELLPHTPVSGFGFNFSFETDTPSQDLIRSFDSTTFLSEALSDPNADIVRQGWAATASTESRLLSVNATYEAGKVVFNFNVHTEVTSAADAAVSLRVEQIFQQVKDEVLSVLNRFEVSNDIPAL